MIRLQSDCLIIARHRLIEAPQCVEHIASIVEGACVVRLERNGAVIARNRLIEPLELPQRVAAIVKCARLLRREDNRPIVARQRLIEALQPLQRACARCFGGGELRIDSQRSINLTDRLRVLAALIMNDTQQIQTIAMIGLHLEDSSIQRLRFLQAAGCMKGLCFLKQRCRLRCACGRMRRSRLRERPCIAGGTGRVVGFFHDWDVPLGAGVRRGPKPPQPVPRKLRNTRQAPPARWMAAQSLLASSRVCAPART